MLNWRSTFVNHSDSLLSDLRKYLSALSMTMVSSVSWVPYSALRNTLMQDEFIHSNSGIEIRVCKALLLKGCLILTENELLIKWNGRSQSIMWVFLKSIFFFNRVVKILGKSLAIVVKPFNITTALPSLTLEEEKYHVALMPNDDASEYNEQFKASQLC